MTGQEFLAEQLRHQRDAYREQALTRLSNTYHDLWRDLTYGENTFSVGLNTVYGAVESDSKKLRAFLETAMDIVIVEDASSQVKGPVEEADLPTDTEFDPTARIQRSPASVKTRGACDGKRRRKQVMVPPDRRMPAKFGGATKPSCASKGSKYGTEYQCEL
jgi:hypothetical protein